MSWFFALLALIVGYWLGYASAHADVARECERLGSFYVGKKVFKCVEVKDASR